MRREATADNRSSEGRRAFRRRINRYRIPADYRERSRATVARLHSDGRITRVERVTVDETRWFDQYRIVVAAVSAVATAVGLAQFLEALVTR